MHFKDKMIKKKKKDSWNVDDQMSLCGTIWSTCIKKVNKEILKESKNN